MIGNVRLLFFMVLEYKITFVHVDVLMFDDDYGVGNSETKGEKE